MSDDNSNDLQLVDTLITGSTTYFKQPPFSMTFHEDCKTVGTLKIDKGVAKFEGNTDASAKIFFNNIIDLINKHLEEYGS